MRSDDTFRTVIVRAFSGGLGGWRLGFAVAFVATRQHLQHDHHFCLPLRRAAVVTVAIDSGGTIGPSTGGLDARPKHWPPGPRRATGETDPSHTQELAILTADHDFWDDHLYPLQRCPGVVILVGQTEGAKAVALANLEHQWGYVALCRATPGFHLFLKITARDNGSVAKFWDGTDVVTVEV